MWRPAAAGLLAVASAARVCPATAPAARAAAAAAARRAPDAAAAAAAAAANHAWPRLQMRRRMRSRSIRMTRTTPQKMKRRRMKIWCASACCLQCQRHSGLPTCMELHWDGQWSADLRTAVAAASFCNGMAGHPPKNCVGIVVRPGLPAWLPGCRMRMNRMQRTPGSCGRWRGAPPCTRQSGPLL